MIYKQDAVRRLYKRLLALYPREFKERMGESMQQTFRDLYEERRTERGWFGFMFLTFVETILGITKEYILLITQGDHMKSSITNLLIAIGLIVLGIGIAVAGIYLGETDDAPGAALIGILLMIGAVALGVRTARRKT
jgi:hypothetical protein